MNEKFILIDVKKMTSKKGENFYKMVVYSNLEYTVDIFINKDVYDDYFTHFQQRVGSDVTSHIVRTYNKAKQNFSYYYK